MTQLKQATDSLRTLLDEVVTTNRTTVTDAIEYRKAELLESVYYAKATADAQQGVVRAVEQLLARVATEYQVAVLRQIGTDFEDDTYPELIDQLATSPQGGGSPPAKQTVGIKTVAVTGLSGFLETDTDVDEYLTALRYALIQTLTDGKRIAL